MVLGGNMITLCFMKDDIRDCGDHFEITLMTGILPVIQPVQDKVVPLVKTETNPVNAKAQLVKKFHAQMRDMAPIINAKDEKEAKERFKKKYKIDHISDLTEEELKEAVDMLDAIIIEASFGGKIET